VVVPTLLGGAGARGGATTVSPTLDPGWLVSRSVPEARGKLFVVFGADSLDPPAGGLWVVVSGFGAQDGKCESEGSHSWCPSMRNVTHAAMVRPVPPTWQRCRNACPSE